MAAGSPFSAADMRRIETAVSVADRETGLDFSVFLGDVSSDQQEPDSHEPAVAQESASSSDPLRGTAERMHAALGDRASDAVLVMVSPGVRRLEIVTGQEARKRLSDRACALAALSMTTSFAGGDLVGGLVTGLRMLAESAGREQAATR